MQLEGTICISKTQGGDEGESVRIVIQDNSSHAQLVEIRMSPEEFAKGMFGLAYRPCQIEVRSDPDRWGKVRQHQTAMVPKPEKSIYDRTEEHRYLTEAVKPWEEDGWKADVSGALSSQQHNPTYYNVSFFRYLEVVEEGE